VQKKFFQIIAKLNKLLLPSLTKKNINLSKANKVQLALIAWRAFITKRAL
tara:strand:- start:822 stop:971 length:150 start_codon:yes stop_codon:yes gene_type:complete